MVISFRSVAHAGELVVKAGRPPWEVLP